ncbi:hypothetical protein QOT17_018327 [Balamuthia mandrillaris]
MKPLGGRDWFPQWNGWKDTSVYVAEGTSLPALAERAGNIINNIGLIHENTTSIDGRCNLFYIRKLCLTYFRPCLVVPPLTQNTKKGKGSKEDHMTMSVTLSEAAEEEGL